MEELEVPIWRLKLGLFVGAYILGGTMANSVIVPKVIEGKILLLRGHKVMISVHLAELYGVETRALNQAVSRNLLRFPPDFMFRLSEQEADLLVSQSVIPHRKYFGGSLPYAFTEQGVAMLSSVLRSKRAVLVNIEIMRAFVKIREFLSTHNDLALKLERLEQKYESHDKQIKAVFEAIRQLMSPPQKPKYRIGF